MAAVTIHNKCNGEEVRAAMPRRRLRFCFLHPGSPAHQQRGPFPNLLAVIKVFFFQRPWKILKRYCSTRRTDIHTSGVRVSGKIAMVSGKSRLLFTAAALAIATVANGFALGTVPALRGVGGSGVSLLQGSKARLQQGGRSGKLGGLRMGWSPEERAKREAARVAREQKILQERAERQAALENYDKGFQEGLKTKVRACTFLCARSLLPKCLVVTRTCDAPEHATELIMGG